MTIGAAIINNSIRGITRVICRVDDEELQRVPQQGPLIMAVNHVNFLDAPLIYTHLYPRPLTAFVKKETWDNPALAFLFDMWDGIPIERGELDLKAFQSAYKALARGQIVAIAPEGTRSGTGVLNTALPGIVLLALKSKAPILPVAYYGGEGVWQNLRSVKRTDFRIKVGKPVQLLADKNLKSKEARQQAADEIMLQIAKLLPDQYQGYYKDYQQNGLEYIEVVKGL